MKKQSRHIELICKGFCSFYKEGKEELYCGSYKYITEHYPDLKTGTIPPEYEPDFSIDEEIMKRVCSICDFLEDGCGYRDGEGTPPCGGYTIIEWLLKHG